MSLDNFIPEVWAADLLAALDKNLVYAACCNRDYEGDIANMGDTVKINAVGDVTIRTYTKNTNMVAPETLTSAQTSLTIDQAKYFNFQIDSIDAAQANPKVMAEAMRRASYGLRNTADQYVAAMYSQVDAGNTIGTDGAPKVPTSTTAYEYLVDLGVLLDEDDVPAEGRWVVIPAWYAGMLRKDQRFTSLANSGDLGTLRNGTIGDAAGFTIRISNNVPNTGATKYKIMAGGIGAMSYAEQITELEAYTPELRFGDAVKGLHLYGAKVVRPTSLALLTANSA